jgi:hypothetical protein
MLVGVTTPQKMTKCDHRRGERAMLEGYNSMAWLPTVHRRCPRRTEGGALTIIV